MLNELEKIYYALAKRHKQLCDDVEQQNPLIAYTHKDFFSLEPYYHEIYNLSKNDLEFYPDLDQLPASSEKFLCLLGDKQLLQSRSYMGKDSYYDSFYLQEERVKWRYDLYRNKDEIKPIKVEKLTLGDYNLPVCFETYQTRSYSRCDYTFSGDDATVHCNYYDDKENLQNRKEMLVHYSEKAEGVETIHIITNKQKTLIYNHEELHKSHEQLLEETKEAVVNSIIEALKENPDREYIDEKIDALLLEYTTQGPFPPIVGYAPKQELMEGENPYEYYWVNEMAYQLSYETAEKHRILFDRMNTYFDEAYEAVEYDDEEKERAQYDRIGKEIIDIYIDICQRLKARKEIKKLLPTTRTFHIVAQDYEQSNVSEFIKALLPKTRVAELKRYAKLYDDGGSLEPEQLEIVQEIDKMFETKNKEYPRLKKVLSQKETVKKYSDRNYFFWQPFEYEITFEKANDSEDLFASPHLTDTTDFIDYFEYHFEDEKLVYITQYRSGGKQWSEIFFEYLDKQIDIYVFNYFSSGLQIEDYTQLHYDKDRLDSALIYSYGHKQSFNYTYDDTNKLLQSTQHHIMCSTLFFQSSTATTKYSYDDQGEIILIADYYEGKPYPRIRYGHDLSYFDDITDTVISRLLTTIFDALDKESVSNSHAIVLEDNNDFSFPLYRFYLLRYENTGGFQWFEKSTKGIQLSDESLFMDFYIMMSESTYDKEKRDKQIVCQQRVINDLTTQLKQRIYQTYAADIEIFIQNLDQPKERIENLIKETLNV